MSYTQLTQEQRYQIYALLKTGCSHTKIAETIEVHKSTISREVRRNQGQRGYRPKQAQQKALNRQYIPKGTNFKNLSFEDISFIENRLNIRPRKCIDFDSPMVFLKNHCCT